MSMQRARSPRGVRPLLPLVTSALFLLCLALVPGAARAATIYVAPGDNLQAAVNLAQPGDTIVLEAGATYVGPVTLPVKSGASYITIQSSALASLPAGVRVTPASASLMPKIVSPGAGDPALRTDPGAHHFQFLGVEFAKQTPDVLVYDLVALGDGSSAQNSLAQVPHHFVFDRCYVHGAPATQLKRGVAVNSGETSITNSHISDVKSNSQDSQAVAGWNGPGPFRLVNNYLEASGENVLFGGATGHIQGVNPADIEIRRNHFNKPTAWRGVWMVKNLLELKRAERVVIDGNLFENCWASGQEGFAVLFTTRNDDGRTPWGTIRDVAFTNNVVRHAASGVYVIGRDNYFFSQQGSNIVVRNNLFEDIDGPAYGGRGTFLMMVASADLRVEHNTVFQSGSLGIVFYTDFATEDGGKVRGMANTGFVFRDNIVSKGEYGLFGDGGLEGAAALSVFAPAAQFAGNVIMWPTAPVGYPAGNFHAANKDAVGFVSGATGNYRLSSSSPYAGRATDGADSGRAG